MVEGLGELFFIGFEEMVFGESVVGSLIGLDADVLCFGWVVLIRLIWDGLLGFVAGEFVSMGDGPFVEFAWDLSFVAHFAWWLGLLGLF